MAHKVFISYRRDDSAGHAGRVHDRLEREFGRDLLFMDVDSIQLGADFVEVLSTEVAKCDVLLAVIGPNWIDARDDAGHRRIDSEHDFVRVEIAAALKRSIPVIPILLEGTRVPGPEQLPDDLKGLTRRNGLDVRHASFHSDMDKLVHGLRGSIAAPTQGPSTAPLRAEQTRADGRIKVDAKIIHGAPDGWFKPGAGKTEWFKDYEHGPEMVVVPPGTFVMGSPDNEPERESIQKGTESPQHEMTIASAFAVGRHAITRGQFAAFVNNTNYKTDGGAHVWTGTGWKLNVKASWRNPGFRQDDSHPVVCVSWDDAGAYAAWLSEQSHKTYRFLTEAEWEYAARAGTMTPFWWGSSITPKQANYDGNHAYAGGGTKGEYRKATVPVGNFEANTWGLFNVHGNVWEWCEDTWHDNYNGAPTNGSTWLQGGEAERRVVRGGSWGNKPQLLRSADRAWLDDRYYHLGFRLARTLAP
jgi:formylglycine-generating enzyme required for sulfatase activity